MQAHFISNRSTEEKPQTISEAPCSVLRRDPRLVSVLFHPVPDPRFRDADSNGRPHFVVHYLGRGADVLPSAGQGRFEVSLSRLA